MKRKNKNAGMVYLVGAGPGAPGLITVEGLDCIKKSEVVVYDRLVSERLLNAAPASAELIYAGKMPKRHALKQEEINLLLAEKASQGKIVTRLKGGDPFVFGRGGEEAAHLAASGICYAVVPGVTSAVAVPAYAGIPVTHRGVSASFMVVTGHEDPTKEHSDLDWHTIAGNPGTTIFLMGMANLNLIMEKLIAEGLSEDTAVALVRQGTLAEQETITGQAGDIAARAAEAGFEHPAVIVIGAVARLRDKLAWVESKPLFGRRIIVTRAREQASIFASKLEELGAEVILFPTIKIVPPDNYGPLDRSLMNLEQYRWIIFTSVNGVEFFFSRLSHLRIDIRDLKGIKTCAIGPVTREALQKRGMIVDCMPEEYRAEAVAEDLRGNIKPGDKVLLPRAELARLVLPQTLTGMGATVDQVTAYRTLREERPAGPLLELINTGRVDMITFTSSSTVRNLVEMLGPEALLLPDKVSLAAIGPITSATALELGLSIDLEAVKYTLDGLLEAILDYYRTES